MEVSKIRILKEFVVGHFTHQWKIFIFNFCNLQNFLDFYFLFLSILVKIEFFWQDIGQNPFENILPWKFWNISSCKMEFRSLLSIKFQNICIYIYFPYFLLETQRFLMGMGMNCRGIDGNCREIDFNSRRQSPSIERERERDALMH